MEKAIKAGLEPPPKQEPKVHAAVFFRVRPDSRHSGLPRSFVHSTSHASWAGGILLWSWSGALHRQVVHVDKSRRTQAKRVSCLFRPSRTPGSGARPG